MDHWLLLDNLVHFLLLIGALALYTLAILQTLQRRVTPEQMVRLLAKKPGALVFYQWSDGPFRKRFGHNYVAYIEGAQFYTRSAEPLELPDDCEVFSQRAKLVYERMQEKYKTIQEMVKTIYQLIFTKKQ